MSKHTRKQCAKCPWRKDVDPRDIPDGYDEAKHAALSNTIARNALDGIADLTLRVMACHETPTGDEKPCVGWLHNQIGVGNNVALRLACLHGHINSNIEIVGEQHETLEDTLP